MNRTKSQNEKILMHLIAYDSITPIEALKLYGCFRLGGRIYDLKKMGVQIETKLVKEGKKQFAKYKYISGGIQ